MAAPFPAFDENGKMIIDEWGMVPDPRRPAVVDYDNPTADLKNAILGVGVAITVLGIISTILRVYGNWKNKSLPKRLRIGWEDLCIVIATV